MRKTLLSAALLSSFLLALPYQAQAGSQSPPPSSSYEYNVLRGLQATDVHYFDSITGGIREVYRSLFGEAIFTSMNGSLGAGPMGDSLQSAMSPFGGRLIGGPVASATPLQREFAALNLRTAVFGLERQVASGSHRPWAALTRKERILLHNDPLLAGMTGY